jgi:hypothetical protein
VFSSRAKNSFPKYFAARFGVPLFCPLYVLEFIGNGYLKPGSNSFALGIIYPSGG